MHPADKDSKQSRRSNLSEAVHVSFIPVNRAKRPVIGAKFSKASEASDSFVTDPTIQSSVDVSQEKKAPLSPLRKELQKNVPTVPNHPQTEFISTASSAGRKTDLLSSLQSDFSYRTNQFETSKSLLNTQHLPHVSSSKTVFNDMTFEGALEYLKEHIETVDYLHCVSRHHIDKKARINTYDVVILEKPGFPQSDRIFSREDRSDRKKQGQYPGKLMQLSLQGVVMDSIECDDGVIIETGTFVPLNEFINERNLCFRLLDMSFFRYFKQYKLFTAWKLHVRSLIFHRRRDHVRNRTLFADSEFIKLQHDIYCRTFDLRQSIDLFEYLGSGLVNCRNFIFAQEQKLYLEFAKIKEVILSIGELIEAKYLMVISNEHLGTKIQSIIAHHPYSNSATSGAGLIPNSSAPENVDWEHIRSIQRLKAEYKGKIERIFKCAEFMLEISLSSILIIFWTRFTQSVLGKSIVNRDAARAAIGYWVQKDENNGIPAISLIDKDEEDMHEQDASEHKDNIPEEAGHKKRHPVDESYWRKGRHLFINAAFFLDNRIFDVEGHFDMKNLSKLRISVDPTSSQVMHYLHELYGALGILLSNLPKLKYHPVIWKKEKKIDVFSEEFDIDHDTRAVTAANAVKKHSHWVRGKLHQVPTPEKEAELVHAMRKAGHGSSSSSVLFTYIQNSPIMAQVGTQQLAVKSLHKFRLAVYDASQVQDVTDILNEIFHNIWALNPDGLLKQLERSSILPLLKDGVNGNQHVSPDEVERALTRERHRLQTLFNSLSYIEKMEELLLNFPDLKHDSGAICCFKIILNQLSRIREKQLFRITSSLPITFITRCRLFTDFLFSVQKRLDPSLLGGLQKEIKMLKAVEYFDAAKALFDEECEICEKLYRIIWNQKQKEDQGVSDVLNKSLVTSSKSIFSPPRIDNRNESLSMNTNSRLSQASSNPHSLFALYYEAKSSANESIIGCRLELGRVLPHIKKEVTHRIQTLHDDVDRHLKELDELVALASKNRKLRTEDIMGLPGDSTSVGPKDSSKIDVLNEETVSAICELLEDISASTTSIRKEVKEIINVQELLLQSHVIVGSALPILSAENVDYFKDMEALDTIFQIKRKSWSSVSEALSIHALIGGMRLGNSNVPMLYGRFQFFRNSIEYLRKQIDGAGPALAKLKKIVGEINPQLEIIAYLSNETLRRSHWEALSSHVFSPCGYQLNVNGHGLHNVAISERVSPKGNDFRNMGSLRSIALSELMAKGLFNYLSMIKEITASAVMQSMIERTLNAGTFCMNNANVILSDDWLTDPKLHDKITFQLCRVSNCNELSVLFQYCYKAVLVAESAAVDMNIAIFDGRINETKSTLSNMIEFLGDINTIQRRWFSLFHFIKFAAQGELDRETLRLYQMCTEEMKKIEILLNEGFGRFSFLDSFIRLTESETNPKMIITNLNIVMEDVHGHIQSILEAAPRLSLLPYHRTKELLKLWMYGPTNNLTFISQCFHEMFEGVGFLRIVELSVQQIYVCEGFLSCDKTETVLFDEPIRFTLPIDEFIDEFEKKLRYRVSKGCDLIIAQRIELLTMLLNDVIPERVVLCVKELFNTRISLIKPQEAINLSSALNQSIVLVNFSIFCEDIWLSLGYSVGAITLAKPEIRNVTSETFVGCWRQTLSVMFGVCTDMITYLQSELMDPNVTQQRRVMCSSLFQLEVGYIQTVKDLMDCNSRESALEMWSGRYQLRFLYDQDERIRQCPFEVSLGCVTVSYGLEYFGGLFSLHLGPGIEYAISKAIGSALSYKGTIFLSYETGDSPLEVNGEFSVNCKDVCIALGRIYSVLGSVQNISSVKLFLARLLYLDAVGCVDFTSMDGPGMQLLVDALAQMWTAIEKKDDFFMVGSLKYPLKTYAMRTQSSKRKSAISNFIHGMNSKGGVYTGIYLIGMASETLYSEESVFHQFANSVFHTVAIDNNRPTENLGVLLTISCFSCGVLLQELFEHAVIRLKNRYLTLFPDLILLTSTRYIRLVLKRSTELYATEKYFRMTANKGRPMTAITLLRFEVEVFSNALWDIVSACLGINVDGVLLSDMKGFMMNDMQLQLNGILSDKDQFNLSSVVTSARRMLSEQAELEIQKAARSLKYSADQMFLENCFELWQHLCTKSSCLSILHGGCASGKTAIRKTVLKAMKSFKGLEFLTPTIASSNAGALAGWRAALLISRTVKRWKHRRQLMIGEAKNLNIFDASNAQAIPDVKPPSIRESKENIVNHISNELGDRCEGHKVKSFIIHHDSLSYEHFIGTFDEKGRWSDGLMLRTLRNVDLLAINDNMKSVYSSINVIVLDGPLGSQIEQLFSGSRYRTVKGTSQNFEVENSMVVFPSGESYNLSSDISILIETSDISQASPPMLLYTPKIKVKCDSNVSAKRLLDSWSDRFISTLMKYEPWHEFAKELLDILSKFTLISDLLYFDSSAKATLCCTAVSKITTFLRYLEEMLLQCHELFLKESKIISPGKDEKKLKTSAFGRQGSLERRGSAGSLSFIFDEDEVIPDTSAADKKKYDAYGGIVFELDLHDREVMLQRCRCSLIYACIWGFGGGVNGSYRRGFFETVARLKFEEYFGPYADFPENCSLFDVIINIQEGVFVNALDSKRSLNPVHPSLQQFVVHNEKDVDRKDGAHVMKNKKNIPVENQGFHAVAAIDVEQVKMENGLLLPFENGELTDMDRAKNTNGNSVDPTLLNFYTPATWSLKSAIDILFRSGARVLLTGAACSGKTTIIQNMLHMYGAKCPHPRNMKNDVLSSLLDIVGGDVIPDGIPAVLQILSEFLNKIGTTSGLGNFRIGKGINADATSASVWYTIRRMLQENESYKISTREHCITKTVFSSAVSLRVVPTADALRSWLLRELGTENKIVLEAPRFTRAVVFIDDLHMASHHTIFQGDSEEKDISDKGSNSRVIENRLEGLLRGFFQSDGSLLGPAVFEYKQHPSKEHGRDHNRPNAPLKKSIEEMISELKASNNLPILHRGILSDPREDTKDHDDFLIDDVGVIAAATGDEMQFVKQKEFKQLIQYFNILSMPMVTVNEIHSALVQGSTRVLAGCPMTLRSGGDQLLNFCVRELSASSVEIMKVIANNVKSQDVGISSLEGSQRRLLFMNLPVIQRLCATLSIARELVSTAGTLLQLWVHEWKRNYLDVFPHGMQRSRIVEIIQEQVDKIDVKKWHFSSMWHQSIVTDVEVATGSVWIDVDRLLRKNSGVLLPKNTANLETIDEADVSIDEERKVKCFNRYTPVAMFAQIDDNSKTSDPRTRPDDGVPVIPLQINMSPNFSLLSALYPAAIAMLLRLVRILTSISNHVVLSGFVGSNRIPILHLASSFMKFGIEVFDLSRCSKATEYNLSTESSEISLDFKSFIKSCVMRACGIIKNLKQHGLSFGPVSFKDTTPSPVLVVLGSAQLLNRTERQILLSVIEGDYASIFEDSEIEGLAILFHEQFSSDNDRDGQNATASNEVSTLMYSTTVSSENEKSDGNNEGISSDIKIQNFNSRRKSSISLSQAILSDSKEQTGATKRVGWRPSGDHKTLQGYTYNWVKNVLREKVFDFVKLILSLDFPRVAPIFTRAASLEPEEHAEDSSRSSYADELNKSSDKVSTKRFSLLTGGGRRMKETQERAPRALTQDRPTSRGRSVPGREGIKRPTSNVSSASVGTSELDDSSLNNSRQVANDSDSDMFYNCPVLGGVLVHKFCHVWWDISSFQSIQGVCYNLLRCRNSTYFESPYNLVLSSRSVVRFENENTDQRKTLFSDTLLNYDVTMWNLMLRGHSDRDCSNFYRKMTNIQNLGVFLTFAKKDGMLLNKPPVLNAFIDDEDSASKALASKVRRHSILNPIAEINNDELELEAATNTLLEGMVNEARYLLPHLLALECPADSVILNQPVVTMEPDRCAEIACRILLQMVEDGGRMLLRRRDDCIAVDVMHKYSLFVLSSLDALVEHLKGSVEEMQSLSRTYSERMVACVDELLSCRQDYSKSAHYEQWLMTLADENSIRSNISNLMSEIDSAVSTAKVSLLSVNIRDWNLLGKLVEDPKKFFTYGLKGDIVYILRGIILLADPQLRNNSSQEITLINRLKSEGDAEVPSRGIHPTSDSRQSMIRKSVSVMAETPYSSPGQKNLTRFASTAKQLAAVVEPAVMHLSDEDAVSQASILLSSVDIISRLLSRNPGNISPSHLAELKNINKVIKDIDRQRALDEGDEDATTVSSAAESHSDLVGHLVVKLKEFLSTVESICSCSMHVRSLKEKLTLRQGESSRLHDDVEKEIASKVSNLEKTRSIIENYLQELDIESTASRIKIARLLNLESIREKMVKAIEEHRQYVVDERKQIDDILKNLVADSCIAVTCLVRVGWLPEQIRQECLERFRKELLSHKSDMSLTESPFILGCMLDRLQIKRWTLPQQSSDTLPRDPASINSMSLVMMNPVFTYVVDPEGTAAAPIRNTHRDSFELYEVTGANFSLSRVERMLADAKGLKAVACIVTECQAGVSQDLITLLSADFDNFEPSKPSNEGNINGPGRNDLSQALSKMELRGLQTVMNGDRSDDPHHSNKHKPLTLLGNLRVIIISALGPIIDSAGKCIPLPPPCYKNLVIVHWTACHNASYFMDPKPFHSALGKTFAADYLLENCMIETLCKEIAPTHSIKSRLLSERVIEYSMRIINQEGDVLSSIVNWNGKHKDNSEIPEIFKMPELQKSFVTIGYLANEKCCNTLLLAESKRSFLVKGVQSAKKLERDMICYQNTIGEACAMATDFLRVTSVILPSNLLPPYALTAKAIAAKCVTGMITQNYHLLSGIPSSLKDVHSILRGLKTFQKKFLSTIGPSKSVTPLQGNTLKASGDRRIARAPGLMRSSFLGQRGSTLAAMVVTSEDEYDNSVIAAQNMTVTLNRNGQPQFVNPAKTSELSDVDATGPVFIEDILGLKRRDRKDAVSAMHFFLAPIRSVMLEAAVAYVYNEVKPGFEWMVKFSILMTTWAQSSTPLPTDELRALFHFYSRIFAGDKQQMRYAFISATAAVPQDIEDTVEVGLPVTTVLLKNYPYGQQEEIDEANIPGSSPGRPQGNRPSKRISLIEQLVGVSSINDQAEFSGEENHRASVDHSSLSVQLPNVLSLTDRRTGFWSVDSKPISKNIEVLKNNLSSFAFAASFRYNQVVAPVKLKSISNDPDTFFRGPGEIDGLNIHRRSVRWRIKSSELNQSRESSRDGLLLAQPITRWDAVLCDVPGSEVTVKNEIFRAKIVVGNVFEIDWLHAMRGARTGSISLPGVDSRSHVLRGSNKESSVSFSHSEFNDGSSDEGNQGRRNSTILRMTRITSHNSKRKDTHVVRRNNEGRKSVMNSGRASISRKSTRVTKLIKTSIAPVVPTPPSSTSRSDPNLPKAIRESNLRQSLARRTLRKQSITFVASPVPQHVKHLIRNVTLKNMRASLLEDKLESDAERKNRSANQPPWTEKDLAESDDKEEIGPASTGKSVVVQAAIDAAENFRKKQQQAPKSPPKGQRPDIASGIMALFETEENYREFKILERHPSLATVFRGMSEGIALYPSQFLEWKDFVKSLCNVDYAHATRPDLVELAAKIIPPQLELEASELPKDMTLGLWAMGKELTIIQTLLLTTVISPGSCRAVADLMFALTEQYLQRGGIIVRHQDELSSDEDSEEDNEEEDDFENINTIKEVDEEDESDEEANFDSKADDKSEFRSSMNWTDVVRPSTDFAEYEDDEDDNRSVLSKGSRNSECYRRGSRLQLGVSALNCWTHLKHAAAGVIRPPGLRYEKKHSKYRDTFRTFENWEDVLQDVLATFGKSEFKIANKAMEVTGDIVRSGQYMEYDDIEEEFENSHLKAFSSMLRISKYRILSSLRSPSVPFRPFVPIFLGTRSSSNFMSHMSHVCRELGINKSFLFSASPRVTVINCSLLGNHHRQSFFAGTASLVPSNASAVSSTDRKMRPNKSIKVDVATRNVNNASRLKEFIKFIEKGVSSTAYLKIPSAKPNGGIINVLEMLDMHSPICSSLVWAAAVHHRSVRARSDQDDLTVDSSTINLSTSVMSASVAVGSSIEGPKRTGNPGSVSVTLEGLLGNNVNRPALSERKNKEYEKGVGKLAPIPLTAYWESNDSGFGPLMALSEFQFHWLPSISTPDLISSTRWSKNLASVETPSQAIEGLIWEELHSSYLYTCNTIKRLGKISRDAKMKERIKCLPDADIRIASGVVTLWRLLLFLRSRELEMDGRPGVWSQCLVPLSMWQIARIVFKISDILNENWVSRISFSNSRSGKPRMPTIEHISITRDALFGCPYFSRVISLCVESLCYVSYADNGAKSLSGAAEKQGNVRSSNIRSSVIQSASKLIENFQHESSKNSGEEIKRQGILRKITSVAKDDGPSTLSAVPIPPSSVRPSNALQFNLTFSRGDSADGSFENGITAADTAEKHESSSTLSYKDITDPKLFLKYKYKSSFGGSVFRDRLINALGRYVAEVLVLHANSMICRQGGSTIRGKINDKGGSSSSGGLYVFSNINSSNTAASSSTMRQEEEDSPNINWPKLSTSEFDIQMGALSPSRLMELLSQWALSDE